MDTEEAKTPEAVTSEGNTRNSKKTPPIVLNCPVNLISFKKRQNPS
jgi:hypothetical protein